MHGWALGVVHDGAQVVEEALERLELLEQLQEGAPTGRDRGGEEQRRGGIGAGAGRDGERVDVGEALVM